MRVDVGKDCLIVNGKNFMLRAGELHYSRVGKDQWADRLTRMRKAGLNAVSTYFMWNWHETDEGVFDFTGKSHPRRDVSHYLDLVGESGLMLLARPGPWVCAEWLNGGLPQWLLDKHPEIMSLDSAGRVTYRLVPHAPVVSYLHPTYLEYVKKWFDAFLPLLDKFDMKYPDRLLLIQADNETCYGFHPLPFEADYNPVNVGSKEKSDGLYHKWLRKKYREISALNKVYASEYRDFMQVEPPRSQPKSKGSLLSVFDWTAFKEDTVTEFLEKVADMFKERGVKAPVCTNEAMAYGTVTNIYKKSRRLFDGIDMYPNFLKDMREVTEKVVEPIEILRAQSPEKYPVCFEFQGGWFNAKIPVNTTHLHQRLSFAHGLKGLSYYMWVGGTNPRGWGTTGESYDYDCAIQEDGADGRRLPVMTRFLDFISVNEEAILDSAKLAEIGIAYYHPYAYWCAPINTKPAGFTYSITSEQSRFTLFETTLQNIGFSFDYFDLERVDSKIASKYNLLVVPLYDFLDEHLQKTLLNLAGVGATILIGPMIPYLGRNMEPCSSLGDALRIRVVENLETDVVEFGDSGKISVPRVNVLKSESEDAIPIATVPKTGQVCGYLRKIGQGQIIVLGFLPFRLGDEKEADALLDFFSVLKTKPLAYSSQREINVVQRISSKGSALLYTSNLSGKDAETTITVVDPSNLVDLRNPEQTIQIEDVTIARRSSIVWPINLKTKLGTIKYLTSELIGIDDRKPNEITLRVWGYIGTNGKVFVDPGPKKRKIQEDYEHTVKEQQLELEVGDGIIRIVIEGIKPLSDLP
jgi:beta-galactosidase